MSTLHQVAKAVMPQHLRDATFVSTGEPGAGVGEDFAAFHGVETELVSSASGTVAKAQKEEHLGALERFRPREWLSCLHGLVCSAGALNAAANAFRCTVVPWLSSRVV
jgi:hypothetical protein